MMARAISLARNGLGRTSPNPLVGAVIVRDGRIVAEGWHRKAGTPHAEIHALNMAGELARGATVYVSLEPCAHYGRTGPCARALVEAGVSRVVVAMTDPNPKVAGKGIAILQEAGIEVTTGVLEQEARQLNEVFLKWMTTGLPFVALKTAMTLDGKIATAAGQSQWITNEASRYETHRLRDIYDGILVGINTALADNPSLTTRLKEYQGRNPVRIVVDSRARLPLTAKLVTDGAARTIVAVTEQAPAERVEALRSAGVEIIVAGSSNHVDMQSLMEQLGAMKISSVLVEGGGSVNFSLLQAGLVDRVYAFIAPKLVGGRDALTPVEGEGFQELDRAVELENIQLRQLGSDVLLTGIVKRNTEK
ncbi:bifunctional diaminohydroxyphosphoribosylaminopyrimidine deaminase/5-amino-6-(5-phosphoribosylamino)uracil reductase RibD [Anaerovibrio sp.]|uniref:bifunctional diaminohydroxyphosphoribosylaminopyrimidine deaminase/5-amino-6-(5-phosphoribosylamino)uracil reductase RibD n=1 Tax=Anaerovibrio sp. TaxID=1872532 RepID=UPI00260840D6|nr:bifunctional diaminohydroxyphosphoribosylaminopyrimidine deaminase/5-amino-6-(5-phosphoribosylamino)uracil reductase RibD [Anaerovibrio sp.]MDD6597760.1 bifunctional diaminohydroxyphosphoribosylaminopyrimidine deaminase/5-amino-6-(5-phosphoribosylamino)uracil reductase RibD [Anaerovibrio sp.]